MEFHEVANIFPLLDNNRLEELAENIKQSGLLNPITIYENKILDGRNRDLACVIASVEPSYTEYQGNDPLGFVVGQNLHRRHLSESQRALVAGRIANLEHGGDKRESQVANLPLGISQEQAAEMLNVSKRSVTSARRVLDEGAPELIQAVEQGTVSVSAAAQVTELPEEEQKEVVARGDKEILKAAAEIKERKREAQRIINMGIVKQEAPKIEGLYDVIIVDPPWPMEKIERDVAPNQVHELDYPIMTLEGIGNLSLPAADNCHLWLWTTHKFLPAAFGIVEGWGFRYVCCFVWHKNGGFQPFGLPQYNCEFALYCRKGTPKFVDNRSFFVAFNGVRRKHSEKPTEFYELIGRVTDGKRIDMFGRRQIDDFDSWGNQSPEMENK